ncbi:nth [Scardovia inopinata]|uniref:Endonuclease III n=2 Tax=Scardovia inopinata TaxID=78259 RepID=W5IGP4_SCAIO|nr:endonuclease III [Scardovia inopinata F0304]BAR07334.1 endonuclease III [Scardovia inopinata JCM 12537]SUV51410.1 nth [Scardovia inopinata]
MIRKSASKPKNAEKNTGQQPGKQVKKSVQKRAEKSERRLESRKALRQRMHREYDILRQVYPHPQSALNFRNAFELLIATMMSAQTTDVQVNKVTPELFNRYPTPQALAQAHVQDVEQIIRTIGFFHTKAQRAIMIAHELLTRFDGQVPATMEELTSLPGVGRKTANVVLGNAFDLPGFPVDTHVIRVTGRLHWRSDWRTAKGDPEKIETEITAAFPPSEWKDLSHRLINLGRDTCHARKPECLVCPVRESCPSFGLFI